MLLTRCLLWYAFLLGGWVMPFLAVAGLPSYTAAQGEGCHPAPNASLPQYLVGYGSLIQDLSKNKTYQNSGESLPVFLSGYKRGWFTKGSPIGFSSTYLGAIEDEKSKFNGVIFKLPSAKVLAEYDARESLYCRKLVPANAIRMLNHSSIPQGQFWIYISTADSMALTSDRYPIVQSYVDIFLSGCLELQNKYHLKDFASDCIRTTTGWSSYWVNDRIYPRRAHAYQPYAGQIDALLATELPNFFYSIKLE